MAAAVCLCLAAVACSEQINALAGENGIAMEYETALFDTDEAMQVNILMDEDEWKEMLENAIEEEYYSCDVEINGKTFYKVGIRPKGNTSLSSIASDPTTDRYSFKLEFDHYVEGQRWNREKDRRWGRARRLTIGIRCPAAWRLRHLPVFLQTSSGQPSLLGFLYWLFSLQYFSRDGLADAEEAV